MHDFEYRGNELYCEDVPVRQIVEQVGSPCYIYSHRTLIRHFHAFEEAFKDIPHLVAFAMKANSNLAVLRVLAREGCGADIVSGGELFRAIKAGVPPQKNGLCRSGKIRRRNPVCLAIRHSHV